MILNRILKIVLRSSFFANQVKQREEKEEVVETRKGKVGTPLPPAPRNCNFSHRKHCHQIDQINNCSLKNQNRRHLCDIQSSMFPRFLLFEGDQVWLVWGRDASVPSQYLGHNALFEVAGFFNSKSTVHCCSPDAFFLSLHPSDWLGWLDRRVSGR